MKCSVIEFSGKQYLVRDGDVLKVNICREARIGDIFVFDKVIYSSLDADSANEESVYGIVVSQRAGEKVVAFKKKRRHGFKKKHGHRQFFVEILIKDKEEIYGS